MKILYRRYCDSVTRCNCSPLFLLIPLALIVVTWYGASRYAGQHRAQVITGFRDGAAVALVTAAAAIMARAAWVVSGVRGTHYSYRLRTVPRPEPRTDHVRPWPAAQPGTWTWRINPVSADLAAMQAEADAMAEGLAGPVGVTPDGETIEIRDGKLPWPGASR